MINDTKVIPARLFGVKKDTGAKIEVLLLKRRENDIWETLVKPGKKAKPGTVIDFGDGILTGTVIETVDDGNRLIQFIKFTSRHTSIFAIFFHINKRSNIPQETTILQFNSLASPGL